MMMSSTMHFWLVRKFCIIDRSKPWSDASLSIVIVVFIVVDVYVTFESYIGLQHQRAYFGIFSKEDSK